MQSLVSLCMKYYTPIFKFKSDFEVVTVSVPTTLLPPTTVATTTVKSTDADVGASTKSR